MKQVAISGIEQGCSQIILGTSMPRPDLEDAVFAVLDTYEENGGDTLDTSRVYGLGKCERLIGKWLKARRNRKQFRIISKCCHHYCDENGQHPEMKRVGPEYITEDLMHSLGSIGTDYFDIFLFHRDDPSIPVSELIDKMEEHKSAGLIKSYGVSNWTTRRIDEAIVYASKKGYSGIAVNSASLSLAKAMECRWEGAVYADADYIKWHEKTQLPLFSWAAQASGFFYFASRYEPAEFPNPDVVRVYCNNDNMERFKRATELAKKYGRGLEATNIALAYVLNQAFPTCVVIGPQNPEEVLSSIRAAEINLTGEERVWLDLQS